jgi:hypothetical protein
MATNGKPWTHYLQEATSTLVLLQLSDSTRTTVQSLELLFDFITSAPVPTAASLVARAPRQLMRFPRPPLGP